MFLFGTGFNDISQVRYISKEKEGIRIYYRDETLLKVRNQFVWLWWIAIEPIDKIILGIRISFERKQCLLLNDFYKNWLGNMENIHPVSTDMEVYMVSTGL